jgi:hypothetical protein
MRYPQWAMNTTPRRIWGVWEYDNHSSIPTHVWDDSHATYLAICKGMDNGIIRNYKVRTVWTVDGTQRRTYTKWQRAIDREKEMIADAELLLR